MDVWESVAGTFQYIFGFNDTIAKAQPLAPFLII